MTDQKNNDIRLAQLLHHRSSGLAQGDPIALPITSSASYHLPYVKDAPFLYGRNSMPTWAELESQLSLLEDAPCLAFPSGMAAITAALIASLGQGKTLVLPSDGYYVSRIFSQGFLVTYGVQVIEVPTLKMQDFDYDGVNVVLLESPSNPGLDLCDIAAIAAKVHAAGGMVMVDNTTMTPLLQRPLDLNADVVVASDTKAPAGHSDVLFGHVASRDADFMARVRDWRRLSGAVPGAFEAWLLHRGLETLEVRLLRMCGSALVIAERLAERGEVQNVRYPGLRSDPSYTLACRQMSGFGFIMGFELPNEQVAEYFLTLCPFIAQSTSFGSTHTSGERRARWGDQVAPGFVRLSVGCEPLEPLWLAISQALSQALGGQP
ncbi:MAG: cystathionine gamma-lyase [Paracoccaceae bacterium]